ncbi:MAG TPA: hypothetical protein VLM91_21475, partial [Candidatus Methylomirabilis sp.]|nr:hypothetical protein [Candidatus Methylomirabilis sp.]
MRAMVCRTMGRLGFLLVVASLLLRGHGVEAAQLTFAPGDVFVSLMSGQVQWRHPDGSLREILAGAVPGTAEGMGFDAGGNLYVTRWCADPTCTTGNTVEKFNTMG